MEINPIDFYRDRKDEVHLWIWQSFHDRILKHAKPFPLNQHPVFKARRLKEKTNESKVLTDFHLEPMPLEMALEGIARFILVQPKGEKGILLNDRSFNLFLTQVEDKTFFLRVHWHNQTGLWFVSNWLLGERTIGWDAGSKIFILKK